MNTGNGSETQSFAFRGSKQKQSAERMDKAAAEVTLLQRPHQPRVLGQILEPLEGFDEHE